MIICPELHFHILPISFAWIFEHFRKRFILFFTVLKSWNKLQGEVHNNSIQYFPSCSWFFKFNFISANINKSEVLYALNSYAFSLNMKYFNFWTYFLYPISVTYILYREPYHVNTVKQQKICWIIIYLYVFCTYISFWKLYQKMCCPSLNIPCVQHTFIDHWASYTTAWECFSVLWDWSTCVVCHS